MSNLRSSLARRARRALPLVMAVLGALTLVGALGSAPIAAAAGQSGPHPLAPRPHGVAPTVIPGALINHGGPVQSAPRVYLDFWGWSSDPSGEQTYLNRFLSTVSGTNWLGTVGEYGGGSAAGLLAGTWSDAASVPTSPSDAQIQQEAAAAAAHFGTGNSVNVSIVVATPSGHSTPGFGSVFCAYHGAVSADPNVTYTDLPYMTDAGSSCGQGMVNGANGLLDGVSIVEGHELAEEITDPLINAWLDAGGNEIGDKCAWTNLANITTSAGAFAVQPLWSNKANNCVLPQGGGGGGGSQTLLSGSFEGTANGWATLGPAGSLTNIALYNTANGAPATAHDGTGYLAFNTNTAGGSVYQDVAVNPSGNTAYTATAWLSSQSGTASGTLCVWGFGPNTSTCKPYTVPATSYLVVQLVYDVTQPVTALRFQVYPTPGGGTTDMDTVSLQQSFLRSGSFEGTANGWATLGPAGSTTNTALYNTANGAPATAHDGTGYFAFNTNTAGGSVYQDVGLNASSGAYTLTAWLSSQGGTASGTVCMWGLGPNTKTCKPYTVAAGTYSPVQLVYDVTQLTSALRVQVYPTPNGGTTDLDTVSLARSFAQSGSFEGSAAGWATTGTTNTALYNTANGAPATAQDGTGYFAFNTSAASGSVFQDIGVSLAAGGSSVATVWLSSQGGTASGTVCVWGLGPNKNNCSPYTVTPVGYTPVQIVFDAQQNSPTLRLQIYPTPNGGTTDLDTVSLR